MLISFKRSQTSVILRVKIFDSTVGTGAGKTGLTNATTGLNISTIADTEATTTAYTVAATNVETITTLGTYAAPTSGKCRFKEIDAVNHKGVYEIQLANTRYAVTSAKSLLVSISGATGAAETDVTIPLVDLDPYNANPVVTPLAGSIASATFAAGAIDANALNASAAGEIADAVLDEIITDHGITNSVANYIRTNTDSAIRFNNMVELIGGSYWRFLTRATELTTADVSDKFGRVTFTVAASGSSTTTVLTNRTEPDNFWNGKFINVVVSGVFVTTEVIDYTQTNGAFTVSSLPAAPTSSSTGFIIGHGG